jgi:hypothetical protein
MFLGKGICLRVLRLSKGIGLSVLWMRSALSLQRRQMCFSKTGALCISDSLPEFTLVTTKHQ